MLLFLLFAFIAQRESAAPDLPEPSPEPVTTKATTDR